ncbi:uncharacterized protein LOC103315581 [Nasonia vitripennis]|uniref:Retrotransposon gag domain-containing protein n=1 Tax=Nasonia vitripennis TaxID=7425 RepID=A0A7M7LTX8_NASVI|nr:uncharacterized protein LOC103315581 [Nasonia vitripennis]
MYQVPTCSHLYTRQQESAATEPAEPTENESVWEKPVEVILPKVYYRDETDSVAKFSGNPRLQSVKFWIRSVDELANACGWDDFQTFFIAKRALTGAANDWLQTSKNVRSWRELKRALDIQFNHEVDRFAIHENIRKSFPKKGETLVQYMHRIRRMAIQADLAERITVKYVVHGIPDDAFHKLGLHACKTFPELEDALAAYEDARTERDHQFAVEQARRAREVDVGKFITAIDILFLIAAFFMALITAVHWLGNLSSKERQ